MPKSRIARGLRSPQSQTLPDASRDLLDRYGRHRRATRSPLTWVKNRAHVMQWFLWLAQHGVSPVEAKVTDAQAFLVEWEEWGWSPLTKRSAVTDLRTLHEWMLDADLSITGRNPWRAMHLPRRPRRIPRVLASEDLDAMDRAVRRPTPRDLRDRALLHFLRTSGCRVCEVRALNLADLNLSSRNFIVRGKGDKERVGYFDRITADALALWIAEGRPEWVAEPIGAVFLGRRGARIGNSAVYDAMLRAQKRARIGRHVHPHLLRHGAGSAMYQATRDIVAVKDFLGHADLSTVMTYVHMTPDHVRAAHERTFGNGGPTAS